MKVKNVNIPNKTLKKEILKNHLKFLMVLIILILNILHKYRVN